MPITASLSTPSSRSVCVKCGSIKKSGKLSCCALGGAWFKKCGNAGDRQFDHTWAEGVQACKSFSTTFQPPLGLMIRHVGAIVYPQNFAQPLQTVSITRQQTNVDQRDIVSSASPKVMLACQELLSVLVYLSCQ